LLEISLYSGTYFRLRLRKFAVGELRACFQIYGMFFNT